MIANPLEGIERATPRRRLDVFTLEDIKELGDRLTAVQDKYPTGVALIRFLMITPCRGIEARELRWDDLDLDAGTWTIPADRYKTDEDKVFPLGPVQVAFLDTLPRLSKTYVFPAPKNPEAFVRKEHQRDVWKRVRPKALGAHALRKTIATALINRAVPLEAISKLLGHSSVLVTQKAYAHLSPQTAGKYLDQWHRLFDDVDEDATDDPGLDDILRGQAALMADQYNAKLDT
jgi:integrase